MDEQTHSAEDEALWRRASLGSASNPQACPEIEVLSRYAAGTLSVDESEALELHLAECASCRTALIVAQQPQMEQVPVPLRVIERARQLGRSARPALHPVLRWSALSAACIAAALCGSWLGASSAQARHRSALALSSDLALEEAWSEGKNQ